MNILISLVKPRSIDIDDQRKEFILNVLLVGLSFISLFALAASIMTLIAKQNVNGLQSIVGTLLFILLLFGCRWLVYKGRVRLVSYMFISILLVVATELIVRYSYLLPQALLTYVMLIVITGILLGACAGLYMTMVAVGVLIATAIAEVSGLWQIDLSWYGQSPLIVDAIGYALVFTLIGLVSWLSNREIDKSLRRARESEAAVLLERDNLEVKVAARTKELERLQLTRIMEIERFAAFGRINATLVHDLANPLMAATLNLQRLPTGAADTLAQANKHLAQIERYLESARNQIRGSSAITTFSVGHELRQLTQLVRPIALRHKVRVDMPANLRLRLRGDPVKFTQIITNLLVNAIESYPVHPTGNKRLVTVRAKNIKDGVIISIQDYGSGIEPGHLKHLFEPFYSTKNTETQHGIGIGLGIVKQFVENDFMGSVDVASSPGVGTRFELRLRSAPEDV